MHFASRLTDVVRPLTMLFTAVTLVSTLSACVTASRGGDPLAWAPPGSVGQVASLESLVDSGNAGGRSVARPAPAQVASVAPGQWKAVMVSGSRAIEAHDNAAREFGQRLRARGVERIATALTGSAGDFTASRAGIRQAMEWLGSGQGACLFFATGHGNVTGLRLDAEGGNRSLSPGELDRLLDQHCGDRPTVAILSECDGGVFLDSRMRQPNRILIAASARGRTSYGAKITDRYVNFDRCLMDAIDGGAPTWRDAFHRALPCIQEREAWLGVRPSEPQAYFGAQVSNLALPGSSPQSASLR